mgnify:CR=1 FL=1
MLRAGVLTAGQVATRTSLRAAHQAHRLLGEAGDGYAGLDDGLHDESFLFDSAVTYSDRLSQVRRYLLDGQLGLGQYVPESLWMASPPQSGQSISAPSGFPTFAK